MKKYINVMHYATEIMQELAKGVLVTTKSGEKINAMSISWGTIGIEWGKPIFTIFLRETRFTCKQLEESPEFTINIPYKKRNQEIIKICGTTSGQNIDKIKKAGLTLIAADKISAPGIKECPLTLECRIIHKQEQIEKSMPKHIKEDLCPQALNISNFDANKDYHTAYYGEILASYIIED